MCPTAGLTQPQQPASALREPVMGSHDSSCRLYQLPLGPSPHPASLMCCPQCPPHRFPPWRGGAILGCQPPPRPGTHWFFSSSSRSSCPAAFKATSTVSSFKTWARRSRWDGELAAEGEHRQQGAAGSPLAMGGVDGSGGENMQACMFPNSGCFSF